MTNNIQTNTTSTPAYKTAAFGARLKSARESMGLECKDAAAQLRLSENIINMLEKDSYPSDLPVTFIRGYIRSYGKFLQIPEHEINQAIEPIKPAEQPQPAMPSISSAEPVTSGNYFVQIFTYLIVFTLLGLVGMWWYNHNNTPSTQTTPENQLMALPNQINIPNNQIQTVNNETTAETKPAPVAAMTTAANQAGSGASPAIDTGASNAANTIQAPLEHTSPSQPPSAPSTNSQTPTPGLAPAQAQPVPGAALNNQSTAQTPVNTDTQQSMNNMNNQASPPLQTQNSSSTQTMLDPNQAAANSQPETAAPHHVAKAKTPVYDEDDLAETDAELNKLDEETTE